MPEGVVNPQTNVEEPVQGFNACIQRLRETETKLKEVINSPLVLSKPIIATLINGTAGLLAQTRLELNLPGPRIPRSRFKIPITLDSIRHANNCLNAIDKVLNQVNQIILESISQRSQDYQSED